jgi:hypothetical protein
VSRRRDALTDEDGIDGPLERAERAALERAARHRNPATTTHRGRGIPAVTQADLDAALAPARAAEAATKAADTHLAEAAQAIAAGRPRPPT